MQRCPTTVCCVSDTCIKLEQCYCVHQLHRPTYLLVVTNFFTYLWVDHCFCDGSVRKKYNRLCSCRKCLFLFSVYWIGGCVFFTWLLWESSDWGLSWRWGLLQQEQRECELLFGNSDLFAKIGKETTMKSCSFQTYSGFSSFPQTKSSSEGLRNAIIIIFSF